MWTTSSSFWVCLGVGALGVFGAVSELSGIDERYMPTWMSPLVLMGSLGLLWFAFIHRREEWVIFLTGVDSQTVRYCRHGPDTDRFAEFTDLLIARIQRENNPE